MADDAAEAEGYVLRFLPSFLNAGSDVVEGHLLPIVVMVTMGLWQVVG